MNNEIKEILDRFNYVKKEPNKLSYYPEDLLTREEMWLLLDYINHLERIKEEQYKAIKDCKAYISECVRLQSRIDKAIEYIKNSLNNSQPFYEYLFGDENGKVENLDILLNILKGEDE